LAAYERALRLLTIHARGRQDLARGLERRGFRPGAIREALDRLDREGWLDELGAARSLVRAKGDRYGRARLQRELASRGFAEATIVAALSERTAEEEERNLAGAFARLWKASAGLERQRRRGRVSRALARRGFSGDAISAMMKACDEGLDFG
jgi:regulatory protein